MIVEWILSLSSDDIENRRLVNLDTNRFFETANNRFASNLRCETFPAHKFTTFVRFPFNEIVALQLYRIPINQSLFLLPPVHLRATVKLPTKLISNESPTMLQYTVDNSVRHEYIDILLHLFERLRDSIRRNLETSSFYYLWLILFVSKLCFAVFVQSFRRLALRFFDVLFVDNLVKIGLPRDRRALFLKIFSTCPTIT